MGLNSSPLDIEQLFMLMIIVQRKKRWISYFNIKMHIYIYYNGIYFAIYMFYYTIMYMICYI